jgi:valyl-tRNA synthetase
VEHNLDSSYELTQDPDVLDTWFSSALWPFSTLGWPEETERLKTFYPTSVLVTGFDIIFFWVARMIMMGLKFMGDVPFREVYVHGLVRDSEGQKMSKSKGNVLDPIDVIDGIDLQSLIEKRTRNMMQPHLAERIEKLTRKNIPDGIPAFGTDALRFTFAAMAATGRDIKFDINRIEGYRNFCNKLWNAARYVLMNTENHDCGLESEVELSAADLWITSRLQETVKTATSAVESYRFDHMAQAIYDFTWNEYCDWYLELSKTILNSDAVTDLQKQGTRRTLIIVMENLLRLAHPIIPYITEEIWQRVAPLAGVEGETIMLQPYPEYNGSLVNQQATEDIEWAMAFILGVRRIKAEMDIAPGKPVPVLLSHVSGEDEQRLEAARPYINFLAKTESIELLHTDQHEPESAIALVGEMKILIPLAGLIDKDAELARLQKEIDKLEKETARLNGKLSNSSFVDKAPEAVVNKEREKLAEVEKALVHLLQQAEKIRTL